MKALIDPEVTEASLLSKYFRAYVQKDMGALLALFSPDHVLSFGTGIDERLCSQADLVRQFTRDFTQFEGMRVEVLWSDEQPQGGVFMTVFEAVPYLQTADGEHALPTLRGTLITKNETILHIHISWPYPEQPAGQSFPLVPIY